MKRHVVYLCPVGVIGGGERILLAMVRQVRTLRPDWRVTVIVCADGPLSEALQSLGAAVIVQPLPGAAAKLGDTQLRTRTSRVGKLLRLTRTAAVTLPSTWWYVRRLRKTLNALKPDLVHSNGLKTHLLLAFSRFRSSAVVWHLHDFYSHRPLIARHIRRFAKGVRAAVAISEAVKADAVPLLHHVAITVIRNGVNCDHFTPGAPPRNAVLTVGLVATYANWKGQDVFLQAAALVERPVRFAIIGGPIYATVGSQFTQADLETQAQALGIMDRVEFRPFAADPRDAYRSLDVVVHASTRAEPFGLTIIEAMACGKAVIVANAGGASELFSEGVTGLGHTPGNAASMAAAITRLIDDAELRMRLGAAARDHVEAHFSEERFGRELTAFYDQQFN